MVRKVPIPTTTDDVNYLSTTEVADATIGGVLTAKVFENNKGDTSWDTLSTQLVGPDEPPLDLFRFLRKIWPSMKTNFIKILLQARPNKDLLLVV